MGQFLFLVKHRNPLSPIDLVIINATGSLVDCTRQIQTCLSRDTGFTVEIALMIHQVQ